MCILLVHTAIMKKCFLIEVVKNGILLQYFVKFQIELLGDILF